MWSRFADSPGRPAPSPPQTTEKGEPWTTKISSKLGEKITDLVMALPAYNARGTTNANDALYTNSPVSFSPGGLADGGAPLFRLPPNVCDIVADGGTFSGGANFSIPPAPPLSAESAGPQLTLETRAATHDRGYTGNFTFGVMMD